MNAQVQRLRQLYRRGGPPVQFACEGLGEGAFVIESGQGKRTARLHVSVATHGPLRRPGEVINQTEIEPA